MNKTALILNSGGLDSLVSCAIMHNQGWTLRSLYIYLGQENHSSAVESARTISSKYCVSHEEIEVTGNPYLIPEPFIHVPQQGAVVSVLGAMYAISKNINYVTIGVKNDGVDESFFVHLTNLLASSKLTNSIIYIKPVYNDVKISSVIEKGINENVTIEEMKNTVSCNRSIPCGYCKKCEERKEVGI